MNPQLPQLRSDVARLAALGDTYANASRDLWDALDHAVTTARTLNRQQGDLDAALLAAAGLGRSGADVFERSGPYLTRGAADLVTTSQLLDEYSPEIFCTLRNPQSIHLSGEPAADQRQGWTSGAAGMLAIDHA